MKIKLRGLIGIAGKSDDVQKGEKLLFEGMAKLSEAAGYLDCLRCRKEITTEIERLGRLSEKIGFWQRIKNEKER